MQSENTTNQLTEHFKLKEFTHSTTAVSRGLDNSPNETEKQNILKTAQALETIRAYLCEKYNKEVAILISSGFRSERLNRAVGGAKTSAHRLGLAADIHASGLSAPQLAADIDEMMSKGLITLDQVILETPKNRGTWVHVGLKTGTQRGQKLVYHYSQSAQKNVYTAVNQFSNLA